MIKRQFGYTKVRYRGLAKNTAQVQTLFALSNLWMVRRHLLPARDNAAWRQPKPPERCKNRTRLSIFPVIEMQEAGILEV